MSWIITGAQPIPAVIGEPFGGGYFAGYISHTADGNPTHALIVAPTATGATGGNYTPLTENKAWALDQLAGNGTNYSTTTIGTVANGAFDGVANMAVFESIGIENFPAAEFCRNLRIGGYTDWYLPSRFELDIAYFNLKPTTQENNTSSGINNYSVPEITTSYTATYPAQSYVALFNTTQERFVNASHCSSTEASATQGVLVNFAAGFSQFSISKTSANRVRAFRRIAL